MKHRLDRQFELFARQANRATNWANICILVVTFLSSILAVARAEIKDWLAGVLIVGFALFGSGIWGLYQAQNVVFTSSPGANWEEIAEAVVNPANTVKDVQYGLAYDLGRDTLPEGDRLLTRNGVQVNRGVLLSGAGVLLIFCVTAYLLIAQSSRSEPRPSPMPSSPATLPANPSVTPTSRSPRMSGPA